MTTVETKAPAGVGKFSLNAGRPQARARRRVYAHARTGFGEYMGFLAFSRPELIILVSAVAGAVAGVSLATGAISI